MDSHALIPQVPWMPGSCHIGTLRVGLEAKVDWFYVGMPDAVGGDQKTRISLFNGKGSSLDIAPLTMLDSGTLQPRKWQMIGTGCSTAAQASGSP